MEPKDKIYRPRGEMFLNNFLGGLAWGLGTLVGATIIAAILGFIFSKIDLLSLVGSWVAQVIEVANQYQVK